MNGDIGDRPFRPVLEALELLLEPGGVAELRAIGTDGRVSSGYFDGPAPLATAAEALDAAGEHQGIYVTLNPVHPALLARRANRVKSRLGAKDATTADADVVRRRWLPVDVDPVRPSGVSATSEEHHAACATARAVRDYLAEQGWPAPVVADSGNGGHLLYRVDLPNDDESTALVKAVLAALDARFSTAGARVDTANFNAARIWKVYGTVSRKGDSTRDRPHRRSVVVAKPYEPGVVPASLLRALAASLPPPEPPAAIPIRRAGGIDLGAWLREHGVAVAAERPWQGGTLYTLAQCPFSDAHADGAYAVQFASGAVHAGCKHDSCGGGAQRWQELRARLEPGYAGRPASPAIGAAGGPADPPRPLSPTGDRAASPSPEAPEPPDTDPAVVAKAKEVLEHGDPVRYFLDCFEKDHVGDETLARCLVMSIASQTVRNSKGLHVYVTGESGKGKSSGMTAMLKQVPTSYRLAERMSNKALYYSDDINPGTVLLLDDIALSEELQEIFKESTTKFTERVRMRVVNKDRIVQHFSVPERCAWWLANVSALYDDQVLNRVLVCWVDDSEEQDREVYRRKVEDEGRDPDEAVGDRFELRVCREMWWQLKEQGLVYVQLPFARRIRMASVRNRRNADVLFDMVRAHALLNLYRRERRTLGDGRLTVVATEEDFHAAAALFSELHAAGGSLTSKFDRNEQLVLSLASRYRAEQFTVGDVQRWTGWNYQHARRLLLGYLSRGIRYPGLLDKSPALSVEERTVSISDGEGRDAKRRLYVFTFDEETHRNSRHTGQVWLEDEREDNDSSDSTPPPADHGAVTRRARQDASRSENECDTAEINPASDSRPEYTTHDRGRGECSVDSPSAVTRKIKTETSAENDERTAVATSLQVTAGPSPAVTAVTGEMNPAEAAPTANPPVLTTPSSVTAGSPPTVNVATSGIDPRRFVAVDGPEWEPCSACGAKPSYYREKWVRGMTERRRLCKRCHGAAVRREQAKVAPLPAVIDPAAMQRVEAEVGRCDLCGLEPAAWKGGGVRLCDACYRREVRRGLEAGAEVVGAG